MTAPMRALAGFVAAAISVLVFHGGMWALLHAGGLMPPAWPTAPVGPLHVPLIADLCFWGGAYGAAFGLLLPRLPAAPLPLLGLGLGMAAILVGWFVVAPLKGHPVGNGWGASRVLLSLALNLPWGVGVGLILAAMRPRRAPLRA